MTPRKRICCAVEACSIGKVCTNPLLRTVCSASSPEMNSEYRKKDTRNHTGCCCTDFTNSNLRILGFGATPSKQPGKPGGGHTGQGDQEKQTPEEEVADTAAHQSHLILERRRSSVESILSLQELCRFTTDFM